MKKMMMIVLLFHICSWGIFGQGKATSQGKIYYIEVPQEQVLVVVVSQPNSPLKIEEASCLFRPDKGKTRIRYKVRNVSSKSIADFTVTSWNMKGGGGTLPVLMTGAEGLLYPGQTLDSLTVDNGEIVPLTKELLEKVKMEAKILFNGKMREVYFLLVDQVGFTDGTVYKDQKVSQALSDYIFEQHCGSKP